MLLVWMLHFSASWVLGWRDVGLSLDLYLGVGKCIFKLSFVGGGGGFILLIIFLFRGFFSNFFSLFCVGFLLIFF